MIDTISGTHVKKWPNLDAYDLIFIYRNGVMEYDCHPLPGMNSTCPYKFKGIGRHTIKGDDHNPITIIFSVYIVAILICAILWIRFISRSFGSEFV